MAIHPSACPASAASAASANPVRIPGRVETWVRPWPRALLVLRSRLPWRRLEPGGRATSNREHRHTCLPLSTLSPVSSLGAPPSPKDTVFPFERTHLILLSITSFS